MHCHACPRPPLSRGLTQLGRAPGLKTLRGCGLWQEARPAGGEPRPRQAPSSEVAGPLGGHLAPKALLCASTETSPANVANTEGPPLTDQLPLKGKQGRSILNSFITSLHLVRAVTHSPTLSIFFTMGSATPATLLSVSGVSSAAHRLC